MARRAVVTAAAVVAAAAGAAMAPARAADAPAGSGGTWHVVHAGQSVQAAVDAAAPGDTVFLLPGTYRGTVRIGTPGVTLRGSGAGRTVLTPAAGDATAPTTPAPSASVPSSPAPSAPAPSASPSAPVPAAGPAASGAPTRDGAPATAPSQASGAAPSAGPSEAPAGSAPSGGAGCSQPGSGVCVTGASGVGVSDLTVSGFATYGVWASSADRLTVSGVHADTNGLYGIAQERSVRSRFTGNEASGNGEAGLFVANTVSEEGGATDTQGTLIRGNTLKDNHMGLVVRRLRDVTVERNTMTGNCAGAFLVGDENTPRAGDITVERNTVTDNNAYCAATARLPYVQGAGIVLTGVEDTRVSGNTVTGNVGTSPLSGGIVLFPSFTGGPSDDITVSDNTMTGNGPADLADSDHGTGNTFTGNDCKVSVPVGRC
jgi:nitrous oxidase accessory protein NosD